MKKRPRPETGKRKSASKQSHKPPAEPPRPPTNAAGSAGGDSHRECLARITEAVDDALNVAGVSASARRQYRAAIHLVIGRMTQAGLRRFSENIRGFRFYGSHDDLTTAYRQKYPRARITRIKGAFDPEGILHLDGSGILFSRKAPLAEFYAHEVTHALDGIEHAISGTPDWKNAWQNEIVATLVFGKNGASRPSEGFAEFGQLLLATPDLTRAQVREILPQCLRVWEAHGL